MKLRKRQETEALTVYHHYWESYTKGDLETFASTLDEEFEMIGTSETEVCHSKTDGIEFLKAQLHEIVGKVAMRNRVIVAKPLDNMVLINETCDIYVFGEPEWTFYSKIRISTLLHETESGWKVIQQHGSLPDMRVGEGETLALEKITKENLELRDAVRRWTAELENKNRELEIEASLERVRAIAMGMRNPDEILDICKVMFTELKSLGFTDLRNTLINFWDDSSHSMIDYDYSDFSGANKARIAYSSHPVFEQFQKRIRKSNDALAKLVVKKEHLESWKQRRRDSGEYEDPRLNDLSELYYYFYSIEVGAIGISTFKPLSNDNLDLLKGFRNVFVFAYRRYMDVAQAEAQAREAHIELALERVRARTMSMQKSAELKDVVQVIFDQLAQLDINAEHAGIVVDYEPEKDWHFWVAENQDIPAKVTVPYLDLVWDRQFIAAKKAGEHFFTTKLNFDEKNSFYKILLPHIEGLTEKARDFYFSCPGLAISTVIEQDIGLYIENFSGTPYSPAENDTIKRFGKVFQQAYTRFLDLQKAEAQAREAQIEVALERVRAKAMAMQKPEELKGVALELRKQLGTLEQEALETCAIHLYEESPDYFISWAAMRSPKSDTEIVQTQNRFPKRGVKIIEEMMDCYHSNKKDYVLVNEGQKFKDFLKMLKELSPDAHKVVVNSIKKMKPKDVRAFWSLSDFKGGSLIMSTVALPDEATRALLRRFANVFSLAYQRFIDLQKAEAQAREAQIEAALEKVRSRSLAMHKSDELNEVVAVLFEKLKDLQIPFTAVGIATNIEGSKDLNAFVCGQNEAGLVITNYRLPYFDNPVPKDLYSAIEDQLDYFVGHYSKEEKDSFYEYVIEHTAEFRHLPKDIKHMIFDSTTYTISMVAVKNAVFNINDFEGKVLAESEIDIIKRFARVFDQAYIRFLDLQKAEAQARESQIQLALERVRARTMAMQHSDELMETSELMFEQIKNLGIELWSCGFSLWYDDDSYFLGYNPGPHGKLGNPLKIPLTEDIFFSTIREAKRRGDEFLVFESEGESLVETYRYMDGLPVVGETMRGFVEAGFPLPTFQVTHCGFFSNGHLMFITKEPNSEAVDIFKRFTKVFNQTYTRFLDLQKAEEQVREAQIEAALERVRSRSLAMHKTAELQSVIHTVHQELLNLNISISGGSFIVINSEIDNEIQCWGSGGTADTSNKVRIPRFEKPFYTHLLNRIKSGPGFFTEEYSREEKIEFFTFLFQQQPWSKLSDKEKKNTLSAPGGYTRSCAVSKHTSIFIINHFGEKFSEAENAILKRFGKVFEQAYTRFLDLQKAEAQAREAQIEAALERVRSRTMAMQSSSELGNVAAELFAQMNQLVTNLWTCGFVLCERDRDEDEWWLSMDGDFTRGFFLPNVGDYAHATLYEGWLKGEALRAVQLDGETLQQHYDWLMEIPVSRTIFEEMDAAGLARPDWQKLHAAYFSKGYLVLITREPCSEEEIFKRFAQVFDQTYTRFLDLQKAEAQAREAQVNLAVERVRARALAMFKSEEILEVVHKLKDEIMGLDITNVAAATIHLKEPDGMCRVWDLTSLEIEDDGLHLPLDIRFRLEDTHPDFFMRKVWENEADYFVVEQEEADFKHTLQWLRDNGLKEQANEADAFFKSTQLKRVYHPTVPLNNGRMCLDLLETPTSEVASILTKMAGAFDLAYKRFEDLQKAEAQAREAQIEAALERVRSSMMAMHHSENLPEVIKVISDQLIGLGIQMDSFNFSPMLVEKDLDHWSVTPEQTFLTKIHVPYLDHTLFNLSYQAKIEGKNFIAINLSKKDTHKWWDHYLTHSSIGPLFSESRKKYLLATEGLVVSAFLNKNSILALFRYSSENFSEKENEILNRFSQVFEQTYTRFLDLQKAETQAREAQIENALEKVRSRSLAMQSPDELIEVAQLLREEMGALGVEELETSSIYIHDDESGATQCWFTIKNSENPGKAITDQMTLDLQETWVGRKMLDFFRSPSNQTSILMQGEQRIEWIRYCEEKTELFGSSNFYGETIPDRTYHLYKFSNGYIGAASPGEISTESWELLKRATAVFSFAYTRFRDLQMAETSARTAVRQASLDRVRAEISSMRHADDLDRITPLFFHELTTLGIPFIRCGVFIIQEKQEIVEAYLSSPDGNSLGVLKLPYQASELTYKTVEAWRKGLVYTQHWNKEDFVNWINQLMEQDQIQDSRTYQGSAAPPESLDLHFVPFTQGMLYVGAEKTLDENELELVQALAKAFSIAYARYEDFVKLEQAKAEIESAMSELKATQSQLVQQEKLASLGQLTAGIAHEIKNPLNFVNNFSEVSIELVDEAIEERSKGPEARDESLVDEILVDIKSNLKKVHEHGSRANGIVTSMLQHSRGGSGKIEPTDLNALVKEYVNLSFHGMRAGKNPIDVEISFDLDPEIKEVPLIKEDFIRVIINLCNNAFDAMRGKVLKTQDARYKMQDGSVIDEIYQPTLHVGTSQLPPESLSREIGRGKGGYFKITIQDNGPGIPDEIKDKILQPFFTTKKGTEGTGLGLSITNDIIKAHGGELKVETLEGVGTTFIIDLEKKQ
jgi:signal transduction histidine kinase